ISAYGRLWYDITTYNAVQPWKHTVSEGFTDGLYNTTLRTSNGGPFTNNYATGDEAAWYSYNTGTSDTATAWDNEDSLEYKVRSTLSFQGTSAYRGRHLKGVGYWSLGWMEETTSRDPILGTSGSTS